MRRTIPLIASLAALLVAGPVAANMTDTIVRDCQRSATGYLTGTYTRAQLVKAKNNLPTDALEYSGCYDQISQALRDLVSGGGTNDGGTGGSDGTGGGTIGGGAGAGGTNTGSGAALTPPATPHVGTRDVVEIGGAAVRPGTIPAIGQDAHTLPTPLAVFLVLLGLGALVPTVTTIARRVIARRRA